MPTTVIGSAVPAPVVYLDEPYASVHRDGSWVTNEWKGFATFAEFRATQEAVRLAVIENAAHGHARRGRALAG
jgi:hypothetical protein